MSMFENSVPTIWAFVYGWFTPAILFVLLNIVIGTIAIVSVGTTRKNQHGEEHQLNRNPYQQHLHHHQVAPTASVFQRLKSINLYDLNPFPSTTQLEHQQSPPQHHNEEEEQRHQVARAPSVLQRLRSINLYRYGSQDFNPFPSSTTTSSGSSIYVEQSRSRPSEAEEKDTHHDETTKVVRSKSESGEKKKKKVKKVKKGINKSASEKGMMTTMNDEKEEEEDQDHERHRPWTVREEKSKGSFGDDEEVDAKADDFINRFKNQLKLQRLDSIIRYKDMIARCNKCFYICRMNNRQAKIPEVVSSLYWFIRFSEAPSKVVGSKGIHKLANQPELIEFISFSE